jgi:threonine dehydratase
MIKLNSMSETYIKEISNASVYDVAVKTPVHKARLLSLKLNNQILLKREDLQSIFSFKCRGAFNKIVNLSPEAMERGVIAASAGNHAQGVALAASFLDIQSTIVMPKTTPRIKIEAVKSHGASVILHGDTFEHAVDHARLIEASKGMIYIPPYDDPYVIAGQGTVGLELTQQLDEAPDAIFIPVGGGGLLAGMATFLRHYWPETKIFGVEPDDAACLDLAMKTGRRETLKEVGLFAEGCAVAQIGQENFKRIKTNIDGVITVNGDEICSAIKDIFEDTRSIAEPAGALAVAGIKKLLEQTELCNKTLLAVVSGANTNFDRLRYISERTEFGEKSEAIISAIIPEVPGAFKAFCSAIGRRNITEFNYRYSNPDQARVFAGVSVESGTDDVQNLFHDLSLMGYEIEDLTDNEMAKLHVRYMVGGRALGQSMNELIYRFEFPERPGALAKFLEVLGDQYNISLFHYRNHGADYGRILVGFHAEKHENMRLRAAFDELGYRYWEETENRAYKQFLGPR